ncbi:MAG: hypothetical protein VXZ54_10290 [Planctomycetota bacterium]|nr:hypothetical protein [Planctomycetota bacterium]
MKKLSSSWPSGNPELATRQCFILPHRAMESESPSRIDEIRRLE